MQSFTAANAQVLETMQCEAKSNMSKIGEAKYGKNGLHFFRAELRDWFLSCGELCFTVGTDARCDWVEAKHQDGAMSVFHAGIIVAGRGDLVCFQGGDADARALVVPQEPGSVYIGQLTGPEHQVFHRQCSDAELLDASPLGMTSVTVMLRTDLFPYFKSRLRNRLPTPKAALFRLAFVFREALVAHDWVLPKLEACRHMHMGQGEHERDTHCAINPKSRRMGSLSRNPARRMTKKLRA